MLQLLLLLTGRQGSRTLAALKQANDRDMRRGPSAGLTVNYNCRSAWSRLDFEPGNEQPVRDHEFVLHVPFFPILRVGGAAAAYWVLQANLLTLLTLDSPSGRLASSSFPVLSP